ncbi:YpjP family protein [Kurthia massiliensis]|uniref:YpjP family protein n=1 Tax=Kurthia massiliensis TaxID=1033739 RepID=UPI000288DFDF|nr:YpjP family protein [Kurthia massiliensis]
MKKWFQKAMVSAVAVVTLGLVSPSHAFWEGIFEGHTNSKTQMEGNTSEPTTLVAYASEQRTIEQIDQIDEQPIDLTEIARQQAYAKFGAKIGPKIQEDFDTLIFPKMQEAIDMTVARLNDEDLSNLAITENPSGNYSEKIFNVYNRNTHEDIIRFHVRTENRPMDGFYYNFHYHTYDDGFVTHYDLGDIYWSKNTPPKWLS